MSADPLAARLLGIFIEELEEQLHQLNDDLVALEHDPADRDRLRSVFRVVHTLKGASRAAGVPLIEQLCHALENDLARARDLELPLAAHQRSLLLESSDALGDARERLAAGEPLVGTAVASVLHRARGGAGAPPAVSGTLSAAAVHAAPATRAPSVTPPPRVMLPAPSDADAAGEASVAAAVRMPEVPRPDQLRISLSQVDSIAAAAGEIAVLSASLSDRTLELGVLRARARVQLAGGPVTDGLPRLDQDVTRMIRVAAEDARMLSSISGRLDNAIRNLRQRPLRDLTDTLQRVARDVARDVEKTVRVTVAGAELEADRLVIEALREPLLHLVRNAVDHGIESPAARLAAGKAADGEIALHASLRGDRLRLVLTDDGAGIDAAAVRAKLARRGAVVPDGDEALLQRVFDDGFSTRDTATTLSGRGVGLAIVRAAAERLGGTAEVHSRPGLGSTFVIEVPLSIATLRALLVAVGGATLAFPSAFVTRVDRVATEHIGRVNGSAVLITGGPPIPLVPLASLLGAPFVASTGVAVHNVVSLEAGGRRLAVSVDELLDERELILRPLEHVGRDTATVTVGTALLGTGAVVIVLGVPALLLEEGRREPVHVASRLPDSPGAPIVRRRVLVVDDSITSRTLEQSVLAGAGYDVTTAVDGAEAWRMLERSNFELVVSDVEMPQLDGIGLCERIRANPRTATLPVILVTSLDEPAHRARGLEAGADAYIAKSSFDQDTLVETVRTLIGRGDGAVR